MGNYVFYSCDALTLIRCASPEQSMGWGEFWNLPGYWGTPYTVEWNALPEESPLPPEDTPPEDTPPEDTFPEDTSPEDTSAQEEDPPSPQE